METTVIYLISIGLGSVFTIALISIAEAIHTALKD